MEQNNYEDQQTVGYRRPERNRRKKRTLGVTSLLLALAALFALLAFCVYALLSYRAGTLAGSDVQLGQNVVIAATFLSVLAVIPASVSFFLRRQKKGMSVAGLLLSMLVLVTCSLGLYAYRYMFGTLKQGEMLDQEQLNVVKLEENGEIIRENEVQGSTVSPEEIEQKTFDQEIEWEAIDYDELPEEARKLLDGAAPAGPSYLLDGSEQVTNFLLFGLDRVSSSDSIILLSVDDAHRKIKMISIPRDSYVRIPEWGTYAKLTYTYHWGGAQMAIGTINQNLSLNVKDYIAVDFGQLADIVDLVGGVEVELDWDEVYYLRNEQDNLTAGKCLLMGDAALVYSRIRKSNASDNEIKRTGRQRQVLTSLMQSVQRMPIGDYPGFIRSCLGMCTTSFSAEELMDIALKAVQGGYTIESYALLENVDYWGGIFGEEQYFYCVYDLHRASDWIYRTVYEDLYVSGYPDE
ncbi:MAG: LCP family protein [Faecousia sp.]